MSGKTPARAPLGAELQRRGVRGGIIPPHRAMAGLGLTPGRLACLVLLPLLWVGLLALAMPAVTSAWAWFFRAMQGFLELPGGIETRPVALGPWFSLGLPVLTTGAQPPEGAAWFFACAASAAVLVLSLLLPSRFLPLAYFLRALVVIQTTALVYFAVSTGPFPYPLPDYMAGQLASGAVVVLLIPVLHGLAYYQFDISFFKKCLLTGMTAGHLIIFLPMQNLIHVYLIHVGSYVWMPLLFLVFGILVDILIIVAFYGYGMSFRPVRTTP